MDLAPYDNYVSIDLEFSGYRFSEEMPMEERKCSIIEIGAVKVLDGK